jgi:hypothetical protein
MKRVEIVGSGLGLTSESFSYVTRFLQTKAVKEQRYLLKQSLWMFGLAAKQSSKSRRRLHALDCN